MSEDDRDLPDRLQRRLSSRTRSTQAEWSAQPAAVLVPLYRASGEWHVLYTLRTDSVDAHRGQVSFPGGQIEPDDTGPEEAALREAEEEVGIRPQDVRLLGRLDPLLTITHYCVEPVVGVIPWPYRLRLNAHEVALAFGVPIRWLADASNVEVHERPAIPPEPPAPVHFFRPFQGQVIWGVTARITLNLIEILGSSAG